MRKTSAHRSPPRCWRRQKCQNRHCTMQVLGVEGVRAITAKDTNRINPHPQTHIHAHTHAHRETDTHIFTQTHTYTYLIIHTYTLIHRHVQIQVRSPKGNNIIIKHFYTDVDKTFMHTQTHATLRYTKNACRRETTSERVSSFALSLIAFLMTGSSEQNRQER